MQTKENLEIIEKGPNKDKIHFPGFRKDILQCVKACDVFVLSSIYGESITKSVLEAMSLGLTPLITDIPGNYELVVDGTNGIRVPSKNSKAISDGILKLYHDRDLCRSMGDRSKERINNELNNKTTIAKVKKLYEELIA
jgi:glycosyltransferase involved in cell wall biosynthesis